MKRLVGYMSVHNGAEFLEYSLRSTVPFCDRFIVLEGGWGENIMANRQPRSTDGTNEILAQLQTEYPQLEVYHINKKIQCEQRSAIFDYIHQPTLLWLIDHDEIYTPDNIQRIKQTINSINFECIKIHSFTFINDFYHYVDIGWNRLYSIEEDAEYRFSAPNEVLKDGHPLKIISKEKDISYHHYSYCHSPERFLQKRRERVLKNGGFKWHIDNNGIISCSGVYVKEYFGEHPDIMKTHPLYGKRVL